MANAIVKSQTSTLDMVISPISQLNSVWSPEVFIHGIPWKVQVYKYGQKNSLAIFLNCVKKDSTSTWTVPATAKFQLVPFSDEKNVLEKCTSPYIFNSSSLSFGYNSFIQWDDLLKAENQYVNNDTIQLKIEIMAEDPNYVDRSILKLETIDKSCDCGSHATLRFIVSNIENLMAVRSPKLIVRDLSWGLTIYKYQTALGIMLMSHESTKKVSCKMTASVKLLSSKGDINSINKSRTGQVQWPGNLTVLDIVSWADLLKPEKGYINNNSITLEVEIKVDKPDGDVGAKCVTQPHQFECSICLEGLDTQDMSLTACGHSFCTACIKAAVRMQGVCPLCKEPVQLTDLRRMYLSAAKKTQMFFKADGWPLN